jgi:hypothetical protein
MDDRDLERALAALPRELEPPRDLWHGVGARIESTRRRTVVARRAVTGASMLLAAAGVLLLVKAALHPHGVDPAHPRATEPVEIVAVPEIHGPATLAPEEASYHAALAALAPTFEERKKDLPTEDVLHIDASLRTLDAAIEVTRGALADHPDDPDLRSELDAEYEQKIDTMNDVLDWTTRS